MKLGRFLTTLGIGALVGMLLAPKKGSELREELKGKVDNNDIVNKLSDLLISVLGTANSIDSTLSSTKIRLLGQQVGAGVFNYGTINNKAQFLAQEGTNIRNLKILADRTTTTNIQVDGSAVDVVREYTFSDVTANHTIAVTFAKDAMTVAKENLLAAINTANEKLAQTDAYTPASLEALQNAVDEAQTVYNKADATQTEVDNAKANVEAKIAALKEKADKSALRLAVKAAEGEAALTDKYTEESIAALQTAIDAANRVLADDNATQAEVDAQVEAVNAAKAALEEKKAPVVKEELEKAVADATEVVGATDKYTEASLAALQSAIDAANEVLQNSDATQDEIDAAVQAVKEARAALKAKDDDKKDDSNKDDDKKDDNNGSDNNGGNNNGNANNGSNNNGSFNNGSSNNGTANGTSNVAKAAKTGDTSNVAGMAMLCLAAGLVVVLAKRRRTN